MGIILKNDNQEMELDIKGYEVPIPVKAIGIITGWCFPVGLQRVADPCMESFQVL